MMWKKELLQKCNMHKIEPKLGDTVIFFCPKTVSDDVKIDLVNTLPKDLTYEFITGPKPSTTGRLEALLMQVRGLSISYSGNDPKNPIIYVLGVSDENKEWFSNEAQRILSNDGFYEGWTIQVGGEEKKMVALPTAKRDCAILKDDVLNLRITLANCKSIDEFILMM